MNKTNYSKKYTRPLKNLEDAQLFYSGLEYNKNLTDGTDKSIAKQLDISTITLYKRLNEYYTICHQNETLCKIFEFVDTSKPQEVISMNVKSNVQEDGSVIVKIPSSIANHLTISEDGILTLKLRNRKSKQYPTSIEITGLGVAKTTKKGKSKEKKEEDTSILASDKKPARSKEKKQEKDTTKSDSESTIM